MKLRCQRCINLHAPTARDRDRLRRQQLQALGWSVHRIWSSEWFEHREQEIARAVQAYEAAVALAGTPAPLPATPAPATGLTRRLAVEPTPLRLRSTRPAVGAGRPIAQYSLFELVAMVRWVESDGMLRTDDEIVGELVRELGFSRRGARIEATLLHAIAAARSGGRRA